MSKLWLALALVAWFGKEVFICGDAYSDIQLALKALEKVNKYYADSIEDQYVDGLFGLRVAQGNIIFSSDHQTCCAKYVHLSSCEFSSVLEISLK